MMGQKVSLLEPPAQAMSNRRPVSAGNLDSEISGSGLLEPVIICILFQFKSLVLLPRIQYFNKFSGQRESRYPILMLYMTSNLYCVKVLTNLSFEFWTGQVLFFFFLSVASRQEQGTFLCLSLATFSQTPPTHALRQQICFLLLRTPHADAVPRK